MEVSSTMDNSTWHKGLVAVFVSDINPGMYILISFLGLLWNGTLLFIFVRHREIRTAANSMILNLVICDIFNLALNVPSLYVYHYPHSHPDDVTLCRLYTGVRQFLRCVSSVSLVALSIQRYCITVKNPSRSRTWILVYIISVWLISLGVVLPTVLIPAVYGYLCASSTDSTSTAYVIMCNVILYGAVMPFLMILFCFLTAHRLRQSCRDIPGEHHKSHVRVRNKSAAVVATLSVLFVVSHLPFELWTLATYWWGVDRFNTIVFIWEQVSKYFLFADSCFNPVALYISSHTFRRLFRRYLCCLCRKEHVQVHKTPVGRLSSNQSQQSQFSDLSEEFSEQNRNI